MQPNSSTATWIIVYDLAVDDREEYLAWFHDVHIPEKLARPGYTWAAHYEVLARDGQPKSIQNGQASRDAAGYIALFGATDTSVLLNPSPAQIKPNQTPLTRDMMGRRVCSQVLIASEEWRVSAAGGDQKRDHAAIELMCCDVQDNDEDFGAWCVQGQRPKLLEATGFQFACKMLATTGPAKHAFISAFSSFADLIAAPSRARDHEWAARVHGYQKQLHASPWSARRIWPLA